MASPVSAARALRYAHLVTWDDKSLASLRRNINHLDVVVAEWLSAVQTDGTLLRTEPEYEATLKTLVARESARVDIYPHLNNYDRTTRTWVSAKTAELLASELSSGLLMQQLEQYLIDGAYPGMVLDFEHLPITARADYVRFVQDLSKRLRSHGIKVVVQVPSSNAAYDYVELAAAADALLVMLYDEHVESAAAGPVAGQGWFESQLRQMTETIGNRKLIVGLGSYGYDWSGYGQGREISVREAWQLLAETESRLQYDQRTLNPTFSYRDETAGSRHQVWFLDGTTIYNQIAAALATEPTGLSLWRLGSEDPSAWAAFAKGRMADQTALVAMRELGAGRDVIYKGNGEILSAVGAPQSGQRHMRFDAAQNLIIDQTIVRLPASTVITRVGARAKTVALTFDDGPDPVHTPKILDILAAKKVRASFFIVGSAGMVNPDLLKRAYQEGHDIGNHTFTHVNSASVSGEYLKIEINATQRLLEATLGIRTRLFRPPYARDIEPQTVEAADALKISADLGYLTIGMKVDPKDWMRPLPRQIVEHTVQAVRRGDGNVVLLHDAGGSRRATIEALPEIIDTLRAEGYAFVPIHELLGLKREDVMPPVDDAGFVVAMLNFGGFSVLSGINSLTQFFFYLGIGLGFLRLAWVSLFSLMHKTRERERKALDWRPEKLSVIIPAFNETKVVKKAVNSILNSRYDGAFEVIVVDDGSSDGTADVVELHYGSDPRVRLLRKVNGGKWSALNMGIAASSAEVVVMLDADTVFHADALRLLVRHFHNPKVGAVAGHATIGNTTNLLTRFQAIEYITNQNLDRRALEIANGITVVPGAIGAWRRAALQQVGGFEPDTLAEDADTTVRVVLAGWKIVSEPNAIARTEAPETIRSFMRQRHRWMFGTLQVVYKNLPEIVRRRQLGLSAFGVPNIIIFQFLFTLVAPLIDLYFLWSIVSGLQQYVMTPEAGVPVAMMTVGKYWLGFQCLEIAVGVLGVTLDGRRDGWRLLWILLLQRFFYRQLLYVTAIRVLFAAMKGSLQGWGKLARTGRVAPAD